jgi:hypothetical protein
MKQSLQIALALTVLVGAGLMVGCRPSEPTAEVADTSPPVELTPDDETPPVETETTSPPASSTGQGTPINPPKAATLTAQEANSRINLRSEPNTSSTAKGYGLVGDSVQLLEAAPGDNDLTWYYVKFDESGAEGWIRGDFINTSGPVATDGGTVKIESFTTDELFASGAGGCGMTLLQPGQGGFVFFNGVEPGSMRMKFDGQMQTFTRTSQSGEEFYGQAPNQEFTNQDGGTRVSVSVVQGDQVGPEVFRIDQGSIQVERAGEVIELDVVGDVGC